MVFKRSKGGNEEKLTTGAGGHGQRKQAHSKRAPYHRIFFYCHLATPRIFQPQFIVPSFLVVPARILGFESFLCSTVATNIHQVANAIHCDPNIHHAHLLYHPPTYFLTYSLAKTPLVQVQNYRYRAEVLRTEYQRT